MTNPSISVVIPTYNRQGTVERAIGSVLGQTFQDLEIIVVDDGSSDETIACVQGITDPRLRLVKFSVNRGPAEARNAGVEAARGTFIAFLDSDDVWLPEKLERQAAFMAEAEPSVGATCTGFSIWRSTGKQSSRTPSASSDWFRILLDGCLVSPGTTLMVRRNAFQKVGNFDAGLRRLEDWDWLLRYLDHYQLGVVPHILAEISVSGHPPASVVRAAARQLLSRHSARIRERCGMAGVRRFRSSLLLEQSVAHFRHGQMASGLVLSAAALLISPSRFLAFASRGLTKLQTGDR